MTRSFPPDSEPIRVRVDDRGRPIAVTWRDRDYVVETIEDRRGLRVTVGTIVGLLAAGRMVPEILAGYPYLEEQDVYEALAYAAWRAEEIEVPLTPA